MKQFFWGALIVCLLPARPQAQDIVHSFQLSWPIYRVSHSLYNKISFIDSRAYTAAIGVIDEGLTPTQVEKIVFKTPIEPQFKGVMHVLTDKTAKDGEIVFQLRRFRFIERSGVRYCHLSASLYAKRDDRYYPLSHLNTVFPLASRIWKNLQSKANTLITDFLAKGLVLPAGDSLAYSLREVEQIDSVEKTRIPLYTAATYTDGIYRTPGAFLKQQPDWSDVVVGLKNDGSVAGVTAIYEGGKKQPVENENMYAVVYKGQPYIVTEYGFYPLQRLGNDFYFTGAIRVDATLGDQLNSALLFGLVGAALSRPGYKARYQMMLDHQTGGYVFIRALEEGP